VVGQSETLDIGGYPRPQLRREGWICLDGEWEFAIDSEARWTSPGAPTWTERIRVPCAPETPASGVGNTGFYRACWYRRTFNSPGLGPGERLLLHFGAVDYAATVWVNGARVTDHVGGYTPFFADVTDYLVSAGPQLVLVRAFDDPHDLTQPRGKQDWLLEPHGIWYPRTTGIWQTVWLERVPAAWLATLRWESSVESWEVGLTARVADDRRDDRRLRVRLRLGDKLLADDTYTVAEDGEVARRIDLRDPGIDDARRACLWSPAAPALIQAELTLLGATGDVIDTVRSYTALRSVHVDSDRVLLNGRPITLRMALDQGYWPDSGLTAPDDAALRRDVILARRMGFNGVRKHQKIEDPRYLYWADALGLLVWEEMPSVYRFTPESVLRLTQEWTAVVDRDASHPCIVAWVPFNESWGVPELPTSEPQRHFVDALYHLTRAIDGSRPVVGNDGWEHAATDLLNVHDYAGDPATLTRRYGDQAAVSETLARVRPAGRVLVLPDHPYVGQPVLLTEFGGIGYAEDKARTWGYSRTESSPELASAYTRLLAAVRDLSPLAGFCYTQFTDTYQEANGLLYMDRTPKFPLEEMASATRGALSNREALAEEQWEARFGTPNSGG
jgi:beta-galactosidase/beta-glucuronidase